MRVGSVIIHDQVQAQPGRCFAVDLFEEADELLMPVPRHAVADNLAIEHAQSGEQSGRAVALVIVRHRSATPLLDRQPRLRSIERLDLAFLIDTQHQGSVWWIQIKADNIGELLQELFISAELECLDQVRLEVVLLPNALNAHRTDTLCLGHAPYAPVRFSGRLGMQGSLDDCTDFTFRDAGDAAGTRSILFESGHSQGKEPLPPQLDSRPRYIQRLRDVLVRHPVSGHGDYSRALRNPHQDALCARPGGQCRSFFGRQQDGRSGMHDA